MAGIATTQTPTPETPQQAPLPSPAPASNGDIASSITNPTPCITCAYDLAGLLADGICPECATPIATTLATPRFATAPTDSLVSLHHRLAGDLALTAVSMLIVSSAAIGGFFYPLSQLGFAELVLATIVLLPTALTSVMLWHRLTGDTQWPGVTFAAPTACRFVRRLGTIDVFAISLCFVFLVIAGLTSHDYTFAANSCFFVALFYRFARFVASTIILAKLSAQEHRASAAKQLRLFTWTCCLSILLSPIGVLISVTIWHLVFLASLRRDIAAELTRRAQSPPT